jgi:predicted nucleic acid-binding protein
MKIGKHNKRRIVSWDTAIFLAWIMDEVAIWGEDVMKGIDQVISEAYANQTVMLTSVLTRGEILEAHLTREQRGKFDSIFSHRNVILIDIDRRIMDAVAVIRNHYKKPEAATIGLADAIHLATAIHYEAHVFLTLDGGGKRPRRCDLLPLNGDVAGSRLVIAKPKYVPPPEPLDEGLIRDGSQLSAGSVRRSRGARYEGGG